MSAVLTHPGALLRPMQLTDLKQVMVIETLAYRFPWSIGIFKDCLRVGYTASVLELDSEMIGYGMMSIGAGEAHILNLCVHPAQQQRGYGRHILQYLLDIARQRNTETVFLEVRPTNRAAYQLYASAGFDQIGTRRNYYPGRKGREDALILALVL